MLEMPFWRYNIGKKPVQFVSVINELREQVPQIPLHQHFANIENDRCNFAHNRSTLA